MWKRAVGVFCFFSFCFFLLTLYIGYIATDDFYVEAGKEQSSYTLSYETQRGMILDTNGEPLVNQTEKYMASILVTPENAGEVRRITGLTNEEIKEHLQNSKPFLHEVNVDSSEDENIIVFTAYDRYEEEQTAQHLIGYLSEGNGVAGLEKSYDDLLLEATQEVNITYTLDALGRAMKGTTPQYTEETGSGGSVVLTIDKEIQEICEQAGQSIDKGAIVVMETATGKLRAVCSFPSYSTYTLAQDIQSEDGPMLNRAFTPLSVGSVFKVAVSAAGLEQGVSALDEYECIGYYELADVRMHCRDRSGHGFLTMEEALITSCNPWFVNLGLSLDPGKMIHTFTSLSFGKQYELAPGLYTQAGTLPQGDELTSGQIANMSFGQGDLLATPVQVAQMMSAVVNQGVTPTPSLVEGIIDADGAWLEEYETPLGIRALSVETAARLHTYLVSAVTEEGQNAQPSLTTAGGKTSTAQTGIYVDDEEVLYGWFAGFTSAENPKYTVVIVTEDVVSGNQQASPVFAEIADEMAKKGLLDS